MYEKQSRYKGRVKHKRGGHSKHTKRGSDKSSGGGFVLIIAFIVIVILVGGIT